MNPAMIRDEIHRDLFSQHGYHGKGWQMSLAEASGLTAVLQSIQPNRSIEIGTAEGGSLGIIAHYSRMVDSIDINPDCAHLQSVFPNVTFHTGPSAQLLPPLFDQGEPVDFVLIDGDHSRSGAFLDLKMVLSGIRGRQVHILLHDSLNPEVRGALLDMDLENHPQIAYADLDFVPGVLNSVPGYEDTLWGGLAYLRTNSEPRSGTIEVAQLCGRMFDRLLPFHEAASPSSPRDGEA